MLFWNKFRKDKLATVCMMIILMIITMGILAPLLAPNDPIKINSSYRLQGASWQFPFGTDHLGRCILSRLIYGIRPSVIWVIAAMLATVGIGIVLGLISGYCRGKVDEVIMRICDIMLSFPSEVIILAILGVFGVGLRNILIASIVTKWAWYTRVIRSAVLQFTEQNYVYFAKTSGASTFHILRRHILPLTLSEIIVIASNNISSSILMIAGLSFLGFGVQAPSPEWGMMLNEAQNVMLSHPEQMLAPGLGIVTISVAFSFMGDSLRDAFDPQHQSIALKKPKRKWHYGFARSKKLKSMGHSQ
ncbi:nickel/cobalt ABC transporter permease [Clostridium formicaceticum]|uniref:Glutathione transport system permease protein GsiD n=1 Tax=Clostridium formicaceticum TaxID=1497 RepID=A0AAC9WIV4_9CLOT|nr:nickel/cobalt ABC transporter permease [Clostridium formicaceticum]AOY74587.1 hypothetical protein BJL90_00625 [Clostridium formicaceticum]ARE88950.1 Glutathione transport system permease protein GsiD [Clostridium formicaceticum]